MKKSILALALMTGLAAETGLAKQISQEEAQGIARDFCKKAVSAKMMSKAPVAETMQLAYVAKDADASNLLYVFDKGNDNGYVVVAGDDNANQVLGYADSGAFRYDELPDNARWWIDQYGEQIAYAKSHTATAGMVVPQSITTSVAPLLGATLWAQNAPYNNMCPKIDDTSRCVTGCAATALAQIMYYHRWPEHGVGSHSFLSSGKYDVSADFENTYYDWNNMLPTYRNGSTDEQKNAVATLMYHCGVALDMEYGSVSSALNTKPAVALTTYLGYDKGLRRRVRNFFGKEEWDAMLRAELDANRPVFLDGQSVSGGHAFVCDGYNNDGYFHINWGWAGSSNGYFLTTALTPSSQGIGGGVGGYNYAQAALTGVQKPVDGSTAKYEIYASTGIVPQVSEVALGKNASMKLNNILNYTWCKASFYLGYSLVDDAGTEVYKQSDGWKYSLESAKSYTSLSSTLTIPSTVADGTYRLYLTYQNDGVGDWERVPVDPTGVPYIIVKVANSKAAFTTPSTATFALKLTSLDVKSKIVPMKYTSVVAEFKNEGYEYHNTLRMALLDKTTGKSVAVAAQHIVDILSGETCQLEFNDRFLSVAAGDYLLAIIDGDGYIVGSSVAVTVENADTEAAALALINTPTFADNDNVDRNNMNVTFSVRNDGGYYTGYFYAYIFKPGETTAVSTLGFVPAVIAKGEMRDFTIGGFFEMAEYGKEYYVLLVQNDGSENSTVLTDNDHLRYFKIAVPSGVESVETVKTSIYPNPVANVAVVSCESAMKSLKVFTMAGSLVKDVPVDGETSQNVDLSDLAQGTYMMLVTTADEGRSVLKFIKK